MPKVDTKANDEFKALAETIKSEHLAGESAGVEHFYKCGKALAKVKDQLPHGEWGTWRKENLPFINERRTQRYMELAKAEYDVTSDTDLEKMRDAWREICGNVVKAAKGEPDGMIKFPLRFKTEGEKEEFKRIAVDLADYYELGKTDTTEAVLRALRTVAAELQPKKEAA